MSGSLSSTDILRTLRRMGFEEVGQKGSHLKLRRVVGGIKQTVILKHPSKDIPQGTLASILKQAGISRAEFEQLS